MTDVSSVKAHADPQPTSLAYLAGPPPPAYSNGSPTALDDTIEEEESSTIKCICGFSDDDGNTVLCEKCDTWQHIVCYYESPELIPDVHECTDCLPRPVDSKRAVDKQRKRREGLISTTERKGRPKSTAKNPKKRTKEPLSVTQPNGWPVNHDLYNNDRKSGSPRDQPPPNKRPKTSHRTSGSMSIVSQAPALAPASRKRGSSVMVNGHSPVKSPKEPEAPHPNDQFSMEFMTLYKLHEPKEVDSNSYTRIDVTNDIATWLKDSDALAEASGGKKPQDLFSRIENTIQDLDNSKAPKIILRREESWAITAYGEHPVWRFLVVDGVVPENGYIGELKGLIGRKQDYFDDPANRWDKLRHPEPFVFFPPYLPIYIDCRVEGNILRYARRSCAPNMTMKILIEPSNDYHFCFLATREIAPGEELTVGWDIDAEVQRQLAKVVTNGAKDGFKKIQPWVSSVLANFGGCACDHESTGNECLLERARRPTAQEPVKSKGRKPKKAQVSPLSTGHATNSRAGSESRNHDNVDDDQMDARSTSGSHKSSSRDITPATHFSMEGELKMSDREKRKLQQQERLFEQLEFDEQHKGKKGKRNSAGSNLNTPSLSSSRRIGHAEPSPSARHREHSHGVARKTSGSSTKTMDRGPPKPKPVYTDASTQTTQDDGIHTLPCMKPREMKPPMSFKRRLIQQAQEEKMQRDRMRSTSVKMESRSPALKDVSSNKPSPLPPSPPLDESSTMDVSPDFVPDSRNKELTPAKEPTPSPAADVDMTDAEEVTAPPEPQSDELPDAPPQEAADDSSNPNLQPPVPPWSATSPTEPSPTSTTEPAKADSVTEPAVKTEPSEPATANPSTNSAPSTLPTLMTESSAVESPSTLTAPSPFSPAVTNAVKSAPARKKLSLSDYTNRRAKLAQTLSGGTSSTPPLVPGQSTSSPTLSNASLPIGSPPQKPSSPVLTAVAEDAKSEIKPDLSELSVPVVAQAATASTST